MEVALVSNVASRTGAPWGRSARRAPVRPSYRCTFCRGNESLLDLVGDQSVIEKVFWKAISSFPADLVIFIHNVIVGMTQNNVCIQLTPSQDAAKRLLELLANRNAEMPSLGGSAIGTPNSTIFINVKSLARFPSNFILLYFSTDLTSPSLTRCAVP